MSTHSYRWRHVIFNTHGTWLHGDPRGFRSREHRIDSGGDYMNPPPPAEHAALHRYQLQRSKPPVELPRGCWAGVGEEIIRNLSSQDCPTSVIAVTATHVHHLSLMPDDPARIRELVGWAKRFATRMVRKAMPDMKNVELWAEGESAKPVDSLEHFLRAREYILTQQGSDAWTWSQGISFDG